jgi:hypothetical protein
LPEGFAEADCALADVPVPEEFPLADPAWRAEFHRLIKVLRSTETDMSHCGEMPTYREKLLKTQWHPTLECLQRHLFALDRFLENKGRLFVQDSADGGVCHACRMAREMVNEIIRRFEATGNPDVALAAPLARIDELLDRAGPADIEVVVLPAPSPSGGTDRPAARPEADGPSPSSGQDGWTEAPSGHEAPPPEGEPPGLANASRTPIGTAIEPDAAGAAGSPRRDRQAAAAKPKRTRRPRQISKVQRAIVILMYRARKPRESIRVEDIAKEAKCSAQNLYKSPVFKREWEGARERRIRRGWKIEGVADCPDDSTLDVG